MRFKRREKAKLLRKKKLFDRIGKNYKNSLNRLKKYSSLNCGNRHCPIESAIKEMKKQRHKELREQDRKTIEEQLNDNF